MFKPVATKALFVLGLMLSCKLIAASEYRLPSGDVLQDPTRPLQWQSGPVAQGASPAAQSFTLNYILSSGQERRAMINGKKVLEGDRISGATVKRIEQDRDIISYQGKQQVLQLNKVKGIQRH